MQSVIISVSQHKKITSCEILMQGHQYPIYLASYILLNLFHNNDISIIAESFQGLQLSYRKTAKKRYNQSACKTSMPCAYTITTTRIEILIK